jgi:hypothetical protein
LKYIPSGSRVIGLTYPAVLSGLGQIEGQTVYIELLTWQLWLQYIPSPSRVIWPSWLAVLGRLALNKGPTNCSEPQTCLAQW